MNILGNFRAMYIKLLIIIIFLLLISIISFVLIRTNQHKFQTDALKKQLVDVPSKKERPLLEYSLLSELPKPVERYFRNVLVKNKGLIKIAKFKQVGKLKIDPKSKTWSVFKASYFVSENPSCFIWDAKINIAPLIHVHVIDSFIDGVGSGKVSLMSIISVGYDEDKPELNSGALYRYLAESVWHPTALLPQSGIQWEAIDDNRAIAHLTIQDITASLLFRFNDFGEITSMYTEDRFGRFDDKYIKYPWEGHFRNYQEINGVKIPIEGEVGWHLPEGWWLFWKGKIVEASFTY